MGIQPARTELPTDFDFTCFAWVPSSGVFSEFSSSHVLAAGTREGVVVLLTDLQPCALLCGHRFGVTDIRFDSRLALVLSISQEGSLCGWSSADGSCVLHHQTFAPLGDYRIVLWPADQDLLWVWCIGQSAWLVNLTTAERVLVVSDYGLQSFGAISLHSSLVVREDVALCVSVSMLRTYKILDGLTLLVAIPKDPFDRYIASEHGLVRCSPGKWSILQPATGAVLLSGDLPNDVAGAEWPSPTLLCFVNYAAEFRIIHFT
jgi:WD40 repeat protein